jgi:hypothetical protein
MLPFVVAIAVSDPDDPLVSPSLREQELRARLRSLMSSRRPPNDPDSQRSFQDEELYIHAELARLRAPPSSPTPIADLLQEIDDFVNSPPRPGRLGRYAAYLARLRASSDDAERARIPWLEAAFAREKGSPTIGSESERPIVNAVMTFIEEQIDVTTTFKLVRLMLIVIVLVLIAFAAYSPVAGRRHKEKKSDELPSVFDAGGDG